MLCDDMYGLRKPRTAVPVKMPSPMDPFEGKPSLKSV